jgi:hypothetical protein
VSGIAAVLVLVVVAVLIYRRRGDDPNAPRRASMHQAKRMRGANVQMNPMFSAAAAVSEINPRSSCAAAKELAVSVGGLFDMTCS